MRTSFNRLPLYSFLGKMRSVADWGGGCRGRYFAASAPTGSLAACAPFVCCLCVLFRITDAYTMERDFGFFCSSLEQCLVKCLHALFVAYSCVHECRFRFACEPCAAACCLLCVLEHDTGSRGRLHVKNGWLSVWNLVY